MGCTGPLCSLVVACGASPVTSISGTVYAPTDPSLGYGNPDPIDRAVVYIPNGAAGAPYYGVTAFTPGVSCDKCGTPVSGSPMVIAQTGIDGKFTLSNVPVVANLPLVIQVGRWRRMITLPSPAPCQNTVLSAEQTRLPRTHTEAGTTVNGVPVLYSDIPRIGFQTGEYDPMECVLRKIGIADGEFNDPPPPIGAGPADGHRVDFYIDNGSVYSGNTPPATSLYDGLPCGGIGDCPAVPGQACTAGSCVLPALPLYDMVVFACVGAEENKTLAEQTNLVNYADGGGRFFATHFSYVWLYGNPNAAPTCTPQTPNEFTPTATWSCKADQSDPTPDPITAYLDQTFPKGMELANWLVEVMTAAPTTLTVALTAGGGTATVASVTGYPAAGTIQIDSEQMTYTSIRTGPPRFRGLTRGANATTAATHASGATVTLLAPLPVLGQIPVNDPRHNIEAVTGAPTSQQWATRNSVSPPDTPKSASQLPMHYTFNTPVAAAAGDQCGRAVYSDFHVYAGVTSNGTTFPDECGQAAPLTPQEKLLEFMLFDLTGCVAADKCIPKACGDYGYTCGQWPDGCGGVTLDCGPCTAPQTCGGGGVLGQCGGSACNQQNCASLGYSCGVWGDGCGGVTASCGSCSSSATCGSNGQCMTGSCSPLSCMQQSIGCGMAGDGCGNQIDCGMCPPPATCGGGGVPNQCGTPNCTPAGCPAGDNCGVVADGCGATVDCGVCTPPDTCGGSGVANVCGSTIVQ